MGIDRWDCEMVSIESIRRFLLSDRSGLRKTSKKIPRLDPAGHSSGLCVSLPEIDPSCFKSIVECNQSLEANIHLLGKMLKLREFEMSHVVGR